MKTFEAFMEATEGDLKAMGASPSQIALLKKRQEKRGKGFNSGDDRPEKGGPLAKRPVTRAVPVKGGALAKRDSSALTKPADTGAAIVRQKQEKKNRGDMEPGTVGGKGFGRKVPGGWGKTFGKDDNKLNKKKRKKKKKDRFADAKSWLKDNIKDDSKEMGSSEGKVKGPQMGIYGSSKG
jgi:hypothetical protein